MVVTKTMNIKLGSLTLYGKPCEPNELVNILNVDLIKAVISIIAESMWQATLTHLYCIPLRHSGCMQHSKTPINLKWYSVMLTPTWNNNICYCTHKRQWHTLNIWMAYLQITTLRYAKTQPCLRWSSGNMEMFIIIGIIFKYTIKYKLKWNMFYHICLPLH